jgi:hypothetical protein
MGVRRAVALATEVIMSSIDEEMVLAHFIVSEDVERSRRFYTEALGGGTRPSCAARYAIPTAT